MATTFSRPPFEGQRYTVDEIEELFPKDWHLRVELLDGHLLVSPSGSSWHQTLCMRLARALDSYAAPIRAARVFSPGAIIIPPGIEFQPDVLATPWTPHLLPWREMTEWWLAAEVLSPTNRDVDLGSKRSCYLELGVQEVWLVDPDAPSVTVARRGATDIQLKPPASLIWQPVPAIAPLTIDLVGLFGDD